MNDGDWICSDLNCGNINFARRNSCYRCNKERPNATKAFKKKLGTEIGKSAAEKSRGLFNADDWQCNKCANVNWARRQTCNVCNAPKFGEVEARTGYGGGYNERGVVEYRRREPSSEDEYDEFGRKKRKRQSESEDKVGITEGPENNKLPPTVLQKESKLDLDMPVPAPNIPLKRDTEKVTGSLSDGSVCEIAPLSKMALRQNQIQNHSRYFGVDYSIPPYNTIGNSVPSRKRFSSMGDKDYIGPTGYETSSKSSRNDSNVSPGLKSYNPVMENRVSSTNNDVIYKFTGSTPAEDFEVTYTVEERVRAAAFAIVYNNCKISTDKFESLYDKPAPDFKTIFGWRQRLITTGCLVDAHLELPKKDPDILNKDVVTTVTNPNSKVPTRSEPTKLPNPDEIAILSECDGDSPKKSEANKHSHFGLRQKSLSTDTLLIGGIDGDTRVAAGSSVDERISQGRSNSLSTRRSQSQDSNYSDSDIEQVPTSKIRDSRKGSPAISHTRQSVNHSDSESYSYNSDDVDFRSRVFGDRKVKRKIKKRSVSSNNSPRYLSCSNENQSFQGYSTRKSLEQSPLVTGNIYTVNHRNMGLHPKHQDNQLLDTDGCSSEYVPTKLAATAKKNYQDFKNNVKKRGFWAKGNGNSFSRNLSATSNSSTNETSNAFVKGSSYRKDYYSEPKVGVPQTNMSKSVVSTIVNVQGYVSTSIPCLENKSQDFTKDIIDDTVPVDQYLPFDNPVGKIQNSIIKKAESKSTIFDIVLQSSSVKNRSVMEIFGNNEQSQDSTEGKEESENINNIRKQYESEWNDEDDILYKNTDSVELTLNFHGKQTSSPPSIDSLGTLSPTHNTKNDVQNGSVKYVTQNIIDTKHEMLLGMLQDVKDNKDKYTNNCVLHNVVNSTIQTDNVNNVNQQNQLQLVNPDQNQKDQPFIMELPSEIRCVTEEVPENTPSTRTKTITPSKKVRILESITIKPDNHKNVNYNLNNLSPHSTEGIFSANENKVLHHNISAPYYTNRTCLANDEIKKQNGPQIFNLPENNSENQHNVPQLDLTNLLSGINTNTLLIALQNLQQLTNKSNDISQTNVDIVNSQNCDQSDIQKEKIETINLTNDEEWEKESNQDESIERELEKLDGNPEDMQCFSDIFDPGPVLPTNIKKLNINLKNSDDKTNQTPHLNENAPVIGSFKSFALPKPILLNRLKLTVKQPDKNCKDNGKKGKRKRKPKASASQEGQGVGEEDEEESGDDADLSKYDLWGSDGEQGNSSKMDNDNGGEQRINEDGLNAVDANGKPDSKNRKRSHSSSSSSSSSSNTSSSHSSTHVPKNKFDDFNLNSERESQHGSPKGRKSRSRSRSRSRSPRSRSASTPSRRKSRDSRSGGESSRNHETLRDKERARDRDRRERSRGARDPKERRYSREGNHYSSRGRHR